MTTGKEEIYFLYIFSENIIYMKNSRINGQANRTTRK